MRLVSWICGNDLDAAEAKIDQPGAIAATLVSAPFVQFHLLDSHPETRVSNYWSWLSSQGDAVINGRHAALNSPIDFSVSTWLQLPCLLISPLRAWNLMAHLCP
jgi:hypothetical protein